MKLLILGGTGWLGGEIARTAVTSGHEVTCLARGDRIPEGAQLIRADRDEDGALRKVAAQNWDAVIDLATEPVHVRRAVRDLRPVVGRYVFVSTISVYASHARHGSDEDAVLLEPLTAERSGSNADYGQAKVACEQLVRQGFADAATIVRPGLIGGPGDPSQRSTYWPQRFARPSTAQGHVLVPDAPLLPTSVIDVRDLADWLVRLAGTGAAGTFNAVGHSVPLREHLRTAQMVVGYTGQPVVASQHWLLDQGVAQWAGPRSLPLWIAGSSHLRV